MRGRQAEATGTPVVEHTLSAPDVVDAFLQVSHGREYVVERDGLREIHVPHCLVITVRCRRAEAKGSGFGQVIVRPRTAEELTLSGDDSAADVMLAMALLAVGCFASAAISA
jgi:hypothetical protein